jgi:hypothetical protein
MTDSTEEFKGKPFQVYKQNIAKKLHFCITC